METSIINTTLGVLRGHTSKGEINGETLIRFSSSSSRIGTWRGLRLLSNDTGGTRREDIGFASEFGDPIDRLMSIIKVTVTRMTQTLVPQELFRTSFDCMNRDRLVNKSMKRNLVLPALGNRGQTGPEILMSLKQIQIESRSNCDSTI